MSDFYNASGYPATSAPGASLNARAEFTAVSAGFDKLAPLVGKNSELLRVNATGTGYESGSAATFGLATVASLSSYLPLGGGEMTGTITSNSALSEVIRFIGASPFLSGFNAANSTRTGYLQFVAGGQVNLAAENGAYLSLLTAGSERLRIDTSGFVGIGVAASVRFQVQGPSGGTAAIFGDGSRDFQVKFSASNATIGTSGGDNLNFQTGGTVRATVDTGGRLLVGTTSSSGAPYGLEVNVAGSDTRIGLSIGGTLTGIIQAATNLFTLAATGASAGLALQTNGGVRMTINSAGEHGLNCVPVSGVAWRVQAAGSNDAGLEWQRTGATSGALLSYNRTGAVYTSLAFSALDHSIQTSGTPRITIAAAGNVTIAAPGSGVALSIAGGGFAATGDSSVAGIFTSTSFAGVGTALTALNASNLTSGTIPSARVAGAYTAITAIGNTSSAISIAAAGNVTIAAPSSGVALSIAGGGFAATGNSSVAGIFTSTSFAGVGTALTALNASNLTSGTIPSARVAGAYTAITAIGNTSSAISIAAAGNVTIAAPSSGVALSIAGAALTPTSSQAFTATPTFNASLSNVFEFSGAMTANVTSITITNPTAGQTITIRVKQDATGSRTVVAPTGAKVTGSVQSTLSTASMLTLTYSAMDTRWEGSWLGLPV